VFLDIQEKNNGNINEGGDWATGLAINHISDAFTWDCDGMGVGLNRQVEKAFNGKHTRLSMFKGSEGVDNPDELYNPAEGIRDQKTNKEAFKNKRAQYYFYLRDKIIRTFNAVNGEYHDPDTLISFDSSIPGLSKLRSELCRMPIKPNSNGKFDLYTKQEMKNKFKFNSPNLADCVMMLGRVPHIVHRTPVRPKPIRPMGRR
jgi:phage terminase large subunit